MKRWMVPTLVAIAILALGVFAAVNSKGSSSDDTKDAAGHSRNHDDGGDKGDRGEKSEKSDKGGKREMAEENEGHGPPPWAHANGPKHDKALRDMWQKLTPEQRRTLMNRLIREHVAGMREWRKCVAAGSDDCVRPWPPGLARLQPQR